MRPYALSNRLALPLTLIAVAAVAPVVAQETALAADEGSVVIAEQSVCQESPTAICLARSRFRAEVTFNDGRGSSGRGQKLRLTNDTGTFSFFDQGNVELVVKVLEACVLNDRFWVFVTGLTNVRVDLTVTDTETGAVKTYVNRQGREFRQVQDTSAFVCS